MAGGDQAAIVRALAEDAGQAAGDAAGAMAKLGEDTADIAEGNLERTLGKDADLGAKFDGINPDADPVPTTGAPGEPGPVGGGSSPGAPGSPGPVDPPPLSEGDPGGESVPPEGRTGSKDPVDLVTGEMFLPQRDLELPGLLPLVFERVHTSGYRKGRWFGGSWASTLDQRIEIDEDGIHYAAPNSVVLHYPIPTQPGQRVLPAEGARWPLSWDRKSDTVLIEQPETGRTLHFPPGPTPQRARPIYAITDRNGNRVTFVCDDEGVPTDVHHSGGYHVAVDSTYTAAGFRIQALRLLDGTHDGRGTTVAGYEYDRAGRLTQITGANGTAVTFEYDAQDRITRWTGRAGHWYEYHFDEAGRVVRADGSGGFLAASFAYDTDARVTTMTDSLGNATRYHWNQRGQVVKVVDPLGGEVVTEQDRYGNLLAHTDQLGRTTRYMRDENGDPLRIERPDGSTTVIAYNALRQPVTVTDPDGAVWRYSYDERGNLTSSTDPSGALTLYECDERGALVAATDPLGQVRRYENDRAGLPVAVIDELGARNTAQRDAAGRITALTDPLGAVTRFEWAADGRLSARILPDGAREQWSYDARGNLAEHRDPAGHAARFDYGPFNTAASRTDATGARYLFAYDTETRLTTVTGPQGATWSYEYDAAGNLTAETDFSGRTLTYRYNAAGELVERVNGAGESITFEYDALGRLTERQAGGEVTRFAYDAAGRMASAESPAGVLEYARDQLGRVLVESVNGWSLANEYDARGQRISRTTPTGAVSVWSYDATGLPATLTAPGGTLTFERDAAGREATRYLGPGAALTQSFDAAGRLAGQVIWAYDQAQPSGTPPSALQQRAYVYRVDGYPLEISDQYGADRRFELDEVGRVTAVHAASWSESYAYGPLGDLSQATAPAQDGSAELEQQDFEYAGTLLHRAGRTRYEHDAQGRVVRATRRTLSGQTREWTYAWNADDQLVRVTTPDGATWSYAYDPLGRRSAKRRLGEDGTVLHETRFIWDGTHLAEQISTSGDGRVEAQGWDWEPGTYRPVTQVRRTWATDAPQQQIDATFYAIITDLVGTPTELVSPDGRLAWRTVASLWGTTITAPDAETDCPLRFPGQYHDPETGWHYNYFRYYDPASGRYTSPDPLGLVPAPNPNSYPANPLVEIDPVGLAPGGSVGLGAGIWTPTRRLTGVQNALGHWGKHGADFPDLQNSKQYVDRAYDFMTSPDPAIQEKIRANGDFVRYNAGTDEFGVMTRDGVMRTYYKPDPAVHGLPTNQDYFNAQ